VPTVLEVTFPKSGYDVKTVEVPHQSFEAVFHLDDVAEKESEEQLSGFVTGLAELNKRRTASGAGLIEFLDKNLDSYSDGVATEIRELAKQVTEGN
jgi:hypothetical protein